MFGSYVDVAYFMEHRTIDLLQQYERKFGEQFIYFNEVDFRREGDKCAAQVYHELLEKALLADEPFHMVSHRYDYMQDPDYM